jgi:hypothetical protein
MERLLRFVEFFDMGMRSISVAALLSLSIAGCGSDAPPRPHSQQLPWHPAVTILRVYAAPDGSLTRGQMEAGLRRDFAKADTHHDGCLDENQVRDINEQRWKQDASAMTPLIDFKHDGCVDFEEFAAAARSLFDLLDRDGNGKLSADELRIGPAKPKGGPQPEEHRHDQPQNGLRP